MKKILYSLLFCSISFLSFAQSADEQVGECINYSDFFRLDEKYKQLKDEMQSPMLKCLSETLLNFLFNQPEQAVEGVDRLVADYQGEIGFQNTINMIARKNNTLFRMGAYEEAYRSAKDIMEQLAPHLNATEIAAFQATVRYYGSFLGQKKSELIRPEEDGFVPIAIDTIDIKNVRKGNLLYVPVIIHNNEERFIFDTGCPGGLFLSQEKAERFGVKILMDSLVVNGAGGTGWGQAGILDSLRLGNMVFKNLTVTVVPPNLSVDTLLKVDAVLGSDIMKLAGEVQIYPEEKKLVFPIEQTPFPEATGRNLLLNRDDHFYLKAVSDEERVTLLFDTGDSNASLFSNYFLRHQDQVRSVGSKETSLSGGFGGVRSREQYILPSFPLQVAGRTIELKNLPVDAEAFSSGPDEIGDGSVGMGFITLFNKVTINFDRMFVKVE